MSTQKKRAFSDGRDCGSSSQPAPTAAVNKKRKQVDKQCQLSNARVCVECSNPTTEASGIRCYICSHAFHAMCCGWDVNPSPRDIALLNEIGWVCQPCKDGAKSAFAKLAADHSSLAALVVKLQCKIDTLAITSASVPNGVFASSDPANTVPVCDGIGTRGGASYVGDGHSGDGAGVGASDGDKKVLDYSAVVRVVEKTLKDTSRRSRNVIVAGL